MSKKTREFSPEFRETAAREVVENSRPIASVARELGVHDTTLGNWVRAYKKKYPVEGPALELSDRARLRELERENRELQQKVTFLEKGVPRTLAAQPGRSAALTTVLCGR